MNTARKREKECFKKLWLLGQFIVFIFQVCDNADYCRSTVCFAVVVPSFVISSLSSSSLSSLISFACTIYKAIKYKISDQLLGLVWRIDREKSVDFPLYSNFNSPRPSIVRHYLLCGIIGKLESVRYIKCSLARLLDGLCSCAPAKTNWQQHKNEKK